MQKNELQTQTTPPKPQNRSVAYRSQLQKLESCPQAVALLSNATVSRLVAALGGEQCRELLPYLTPHQTTSLFDAELWQSTARGKQETIDKKSLECWIKIWHELGDDYICEVFKNLGTQFLSVFVIAFAEVNDVAAHTLGLVDLEPQTENDRVDFSDLLFKTYVVKPTIFDPETREVFIHILNVLWELEPEFLQCSLALCLSSADERGEQTATVDEEIVDNAACEREERREIDGYLTPAQALEVWWKLLTNETIDDVNRLFMKSERKVSSAYAVTSQHEVQTNPSAPSNFSDDVLLLAADVELNIQQIEFINSTQQTVRLLSSTPQKESLEQLMRRLTESFPNEADLVQRELGWLANILMHALNVDSRQLTPSEALQAILKTVTLSLENVHDTELFIRTNRIIGSFRLGLKKLSQNVSMQVAKKVDSILRARNPDTALLRQIWFDTVEQKKIRPASFVELVKANRFSEVRLLLNKFSDVVRPETIYVLSRLVEEFPVFPIQLEWQGSIGLKPGWRFFETQSDLARVDNFVQQLECRI